ncbi:MAG: hypothetical protein IJW54_04025 [Clostridia bacterium]|nr:hypothetical protein [Clostridia bacterium]
MKYVSPEYNNEVLTAGEIMNNMEFSPNDISETKGTAASLGYGSAGLFDGDSADTVYTKGQSHVDIETLF